ncbi:hypothetical protein CBL_01103 [Carabus blaptoides fortunei]
MNCLPSANYNSKNQKQAKIHYNLINFQDWYDASLPWKYGFVLLKNVALLSFLLKWSTGEVLKNESVVCVRYDARSLTDLDSYRRRVPRAYVRLLPPLRGVSRPMVAVLRCAGASHLHVQPGLVPVSLTQTNTSNHNVQRPRYHSFADFSVTSYKDTDRFSS